MPLILMARNRAVAPTPRAFSGPVASVTVWRALSGVGARVRTERLRTFTGLYAQAATFDPSSVSVPGGSTGVVLHRGLPESAVDYAVSMREGETAPRLEATLRGRVRIEGAVSLTVSALGHTQTYGPFGALGYTYTRTPTGWVTRVSSADMSAADAEADSPYMAPFEEEFLPWERERDLTPYQQAVQAKEKAKAERETRRRQREREKQLQKQMQERPMSPQRLAALQLELCRLQKQAGPPPDRRHVPVQDVIHHALRHLGIPFTLGGPLPFAGDFFWASEDTGQAFGDGTLIGVSFQIKDKTPVQVLEELLGPVGWTVTIRFGRAYIGRPEKLEDAEKTAGTLELEEDLLTGLSIEHVNPEAAQGNGNRQLPRRVTLTGASARVYLDPLPPEEDEDEDEAKFEKEKDSILRGFTSVVGYSVLGVERLESRTDWEKEKRRGVLVSERSKTFGMVPVVGGYRLEGSVAAGFTVAVEEWREREVRTTSYLYMDPFYPAAMTEQLTEVDGYAEPLGRNIRLETTRVTQDWHEEGWQRLKVTVKETIADWQTWESEDGKTRMTYGTLTQESETEEWLPLGPEQWKHTITRTRRSWWPMFENGESAEARRRTKTEVLVDDLTDQGPPRAPEDHLSGVPAECEKEPEEGFPYDVPLESVLEPGGRGDAIERSIPWATTIPAYWLEDVVAGIRRARPAKRTKYELTAPPKVTVGTRIKDFSLSGSAASVKATVTVEEALDVQEG